jgi:hypothetical protein
MNPTRHLATSLVASLMCLSLAAHAQESANADLDACVKEQQIVLTAKGAGMGALAGLGTALFSKNKDALKNAAIGAVVGGAAGFATAYFTAIDTCYKQTRPGSPNRRSSAPRPTPRSRRRPSTRPARASRPRRPSSPCRPPSGR